MSNKYYSVVSNSAVQLHRIVLFGCIERHYSVAPKRIGGLLLRFEAIKIV